MSDDLDRETIRREFREANNMSPSEIEDWLDTEGSRSVGMTREGEDEAVGHKQGRRLVEIKRKHVADLTDEDYEDMRKAVGYVHRHLAQGGPAEDAEHSPWRYSLMNWGHDPLKD